MDDRSRLESLLRANENMVLSTADVNGNPWVTPVGYTHDKDYCLYWTSSKNSRHSSNIRARKVVAAVIYKLQPLRDACYMEAEAQELINEKEILNAIKVINTREHPAKYRIVSPKDVTGEAEWRIYKATPKAVYLREQTTVRGQAVTVRRKIKL